MPHLSVLRQRDMGHCCSIPVVDNLGAVFFLQLFTPLDFFEYLSDQGVRLQSTKRVRLSTNSVDNPVGALRVPPGAVVGSIT
jgi:hypothetical protein